METSDSDMESAVSSFYDRVPNRFTRTSIAPHETMDFSPGTMPLEYPYPPSCPSRVVSTSLRRFPLRNSKDSISLVDPSIERRDGERNFLFERVQLISPEKMIFATRSS